jgi:hypothetical protein
MVNAGLRRKARENTGKKERHREYGEYGTHAVNKCWKPVKSRNDDREENTLYELRTGE